ncbi:hypothetical protein F5Y10DRAFT_239418 [Nemania abortiva]|nr:hypothetical protein F5Y10DRAFT_239418 [Nemania abortiva]
MIASPWLVLLQRGRAARHVISTSQLPHGRRWLALSWRDTTVPTGATVQCKISAADLVFVRGTLGALAKHYRRNTTYTLTSWRFCGELTRYTQSGESTSTSTHTYA